MKGPEWERGAANGAPPEAVKKSLPQPTKLTRERPTDFVMIDETRCADPLWHFRLAARWPQDVGPSIGIAPTRDEPQRLLWLRREGPIADIEVTGHLLAREIDPVDFLDEQLEDLTVVSREPVRLLGGVVGDSVATWTADGEPYAGRFVATKWGPRLFVISISAKLDDYERVAEDFFTTIASFEALDGSPGLFAQTVKQVKQTSPIKWGAVIPDAWTLMPTSIEEGIGSFQAARARGYDLSTVDGQLSFAVANRTVAKKPRDAARMFLASVEQHGITIGREDFVEEPAPKPFEKSWVSVTECKKGDLLGEVRCRVMMHPKVWAVGGVLGPIRDHDRAAWMENKRALDVVTSTLELS
jgi:hypothetical protein